jgi:nucleotide-binding universal stress UspA family protein
MVNRATMQIVRVIDEGVSIPTMAQLRDIEREAIRKDIELQVAQAREQEYSKLKKQLDMASSKGIEAFTQVLEGEVVEKITSLIDQERPYIVVVGSRKLKLRGLSKLMILGSVARKLSEESNCPVLIVR